MIKNNNNIDSHSNSCDIACECQMHPAAVLTPLPGQLSFDETGRLTTGKIKTKSTGVVLRVDDASGCPVDDMEVGGDESASMGVSKVGGDEMVTSCHHVSSSQHSTGSQTTLNKFFLSVAGGHQKTPANGLFTHF